MQLYIYMLLTFILTFIILKFLIKYQNKNKIGQFEREEGLVTHKKKANTPIFGGIAFIISFILTFTIMLLIKEFSFLQYLMITFPMISFGIIGLIDDVLILKQQKNDGISPRIKLFLQLVISVIYFIIYLILDFNTKINLIFFDIDLKFFYGIFILLSFSGFTNATNLTDGIDGLLGGVLSIIFIGFFFISSDIIEQKIAVIIFSGLSAFLYFNLPKAKIFMGNVGSYSLGAIFVSVAILFNQEILLFIFGLIFIIEAFSVVIQVYYFKLTKGKRLFKMAPIHHHFEIIFNSEVMTLLLFYLFTIFCVVMSFFVF